MLDRLRRLFSRHFVGNEALRCQGAVGQKIKRKSHVFPARPAPGVRGRISGNVFVGADNGHPGLMNVGVRVEFNGSAGTSG